MLYLAKRKSCIKAKYRLMKTEDSLNNTKNKELVHTFKNGAIIAE